VHLELATAVAGGDPALGVIEERGHVLGGQPHEPLEADGAGKGLLHADGRRDDRPYAAELLEDLLAGRAGDGAVEQVAREIRLQKIPAPRGNHVAAECTMRPWPPTRRRTSTSPGSSTRWPRCWRRATSPCSACAPISAGPRHWRRSVRTWRPSPPAAASPPCPAS